VDELSKTVNKTPVVRIIDPPSGQTLVRIRNAKFKINGFSENGKNCIDLKKFMKDRKGSPDFGFETGNTV
jgi:hypothetical protein